MSIFHSTTETPGLGEYHPGSGSLGGAPVQHNYKRAVIKAPPRVFTVQVLPPMKFGSGYCYGLRIYPILREPRDDQSSRSSRSSGSNGSQTTEYEVWRRWDDCMWFQELLEIEYSVMARTKRQRLAAGKGVKKDGMYIHSDQAASFESLPPGPEVSSIAQDVHEIIPKLSKKGSLFRPSQATIDQRGKEFQAMIEAIFEDDVPTLIKELRDSRVIRDFFGYWRRDKDRERKANEKEVGPGSRPGSSRGVRSSIASSAFSMYFSSSNISLQLPGAFADLPPSPPLPQDAQARRDSVMQKAPIPSSPSSNSHRTSRSSPPTGVTFTVTETGTLVPAKADRDEDYLDHRAAHCSVPFSPTSARWSQASSLPGFPSHESSSESEDVPVMFMSESDHRPESLMHDRPNCLEVLPEGEELESSLSSMTLSPAEELPAPLRRPRINSLPDRTSHRNCLIFTTTPDGPAVVEPDGILTMEGLIPEDLSSQSMIAADAAGIPKTPTTYSNSSRHSSIALSSFSDRSSWRTSIASETSIASTSSTSVAWRDSCVDSAYLHGSMVSSEGGGLQSNHRQRASCATMNSVISGSSVDAILPRKVSSTPVGLRRSLSAGSRHSCAIPTALSVPTEDVWYEQQQEDLIDAYFYDPSLRPSSPEVQYEEEVPQTPGRERISQLITKSISTPDHFPKPFQNRPPGQFHLPWNSPTSPPLSSAGSLSSTAGTEAFTIKAVREDTIVLLRATYSMSLSQIREKIRDKFSTQEGIPLSDTFTIGVGAAPIAAADQKSARGRPRSNSTSAIGLLNSNGVRYVTTERDWQEITAACSSKLTLWIFDRF